jgi:hypothetical protein
VRRRAIRITMIVAMALLLAPTLAAAAPGHRGSGGGSRGHGSHGWGGSRWSHGSAHGRRHWHGSGWGGFAIGVGVGTLLTAPWWIYPRVYAAPVYPAYPVYAPPYPAYPVYPGYSADPVVYPSSAAPYAAPPPPPPPSGSQEASPEPLGSVAPGPLAPTPGLSSSGSPAPQDPSAGAAPSGSGVVSVPLPPAGCETVTVAGHWEMRVYSDGQRLTVWVPTSTRSVCR